MNLYEVMIHPFVEYGFMRRSLVACLALGMSCGPVGTLLIMRRMSLVGDAMAHALLPGAAVGFLIAGFSLYAMSIGGFVAALLVAGLAALTSRHTSQKEDASFASFYLIALAIGVVIISMRGSSVDLMHVLFGNVLSVNRDSLLLIAGIATFTLMTLAIFYRPLIVECFDPVFLRSVSDNRSGGIAHFVFLLLLVANLIGGFHALGTLLSVGLMILPAVAARFWAVRLWSISSLAAIFALLSGYGGLLLSYHHDFPSGPAIVLIAGCIYIFSIVIGRRDGLLRAVTTQNLAKERQ